MTFKENREAFNMYREIVREYGSWSNKAQYFEIIFESCFDGLIPYSELTNNYDEIMYDEIPDSEYEFLVQSARAIYGLTK